MKVEKSLRLFLAENKDFSLKLYNTDDPALTLNIIFNPGLRFLFRLVFASVNSCFENFKILFPYIKTNWHPIEIITFLKTKEEKEK